MSAQDLLATIVFEQSPPPGFFWAGGSDREEEGQWTYQYDGQLVSADQWKPGEKCRLVLQNDPSVLQPVLTITERAPRAFSWLKAATTAFTFKTLFRHYAKWTLTPQ